jgi:hypothetical protein
VINIEKSTAEILDNYAIAKLKAERIGTEQTKIRLQKYKIGFEEVKHKYPKFDWDFILQMFVDVNSLIWKYEAAIRQGTIDDDPFVVHTRTILVREFNLLRVAIGNLISILVNEVDELNLKKNHVSESK